MFRENCGIPAASDIPDLNRLIRACRGEYFAVGTKGNRGDCTGVRLNGKSVLTAGHVPQSNSLVLAPSRGERLAIRAECYRANFRDRERQCGDQIAGSDIPDLDRGLQATRGEQFAVRAERDTVDLDSICFL